MLVVNIISIMPMLVHMFVSDLVLVLVPLLIQFMEISVSTIISSSGINNLNGSVTSIIADFSTDTSISLDLRNLWVLLLVQVIALVFEFKIDRLAFNAVNSILLLVFLIVSGPVVTIGRFKNAVTRPAVISVIGLALDPIASVIAKLGISFCPTYPILIQQLKLLYMLVLTFDNNAITY